MVQLQTKVMKRRKVPYHNPSECDHFLNGKHIHYKPQKATEGKKIIPHYTNDGCRRLFIPSRKPIIYPKILPDSECVRLKDQAKVVTKQEKQKLIEEGYEKRAKLREESQQRKDLLSKALIQTSKRQVVSEPDVDDKDARLLKRAHEMLQEDEQEVRQFNSIVLATKCKAIREAQIAEKKMIDMELKEENDRLDGMMEQQRQLQIAREKEKKQNEVEKNLKFVSEVQQQQRENDMLRMLEAEKLEHETRRINKAFIAMQKEDAERERQRLENVKKIQKDLLESTANMENYKRMQEEEERIQNEKVKQFMRQKAEREEAREKELEEIRLKKEKEIAKIARMQQKAQDLKAIADELNARREKERAEKAWRDKEKLAALKRKEQNEILKRERQKQIDELRRQQALDLERDREECLQVAKVQKEQFEKEKKVREKKWEEANQYRKELLKQINQNERNRINLRHRKFKEGEALQMEQELRTLTIKETLEKKMAHLKDYNLKDKHINDIQRRMTLIIK